MINFLKKLSISTLLFISMFSWAYADENKTNIYLFGREDCNFCQLEESFLEDLTLERSDFEAIYLDVNDSEVRNKFNQLTELHNISKATPITLVGNSVIQGFNSRETTGESIIEELDNQTEKKTISIENYLIKSRDVFFDEDSICDDDEATSCAIDVKQNTEIKVPFFGVLDFKDFSLFSMSVILGFVDGFNPCAMWVLLTFLLILWQVGNRKKMFQVAGLFIFAEAIMYWLILNVWFRAWDFIGLDKIVTPLVGLLAIGGGIYFLSRYYKNRKNFTCDIASAEYKNKTETKIGKLIKSPMTILTALGIIGVAFSVNIIEFACSVGIPQAYTKILEINSLNVFVEQFYMLIYIVFYMADDFIIFGLALYGFEKFYAVGQKYSNLSSLIGGILMLILGGLLLLAPNLLVF